MWPWIPMAIAMGTLLGVLYYVLGELSAPVALHLTVNYKNLHFINTYDPEVASADGAREGA